MIKEFDFLRDAMREQEKVASEKGSAYLLQTDLWMFAVATTAAEAIELIADGAKIIDEIR